MFDGNGNWTSDFSAQADRDNGIKILASRFDNIFIADIKESFENCLTKDGQIAPIGNFNMGGQKITNVGNGTNDNDAVNKSQLNNAVSSSVSNLLSSLYPVGSIYIGTQSTCPLASLISGSTWTKISGDKVLQSSSSSHAANTTIAAGLPNITGTMKTIESFSGGNAPETSGAFSATRTGSGSTSSQGNTSHSTITFNAKNSNSIYGKSSTVQPPAYVVNVWRRTA